MGSLRVELTVEPFTEGEPGPHVHAVAKALEEAGLEPDVGPFATSAEGDDARVLEALAAATAASFANGATALAVSVRRVKEVAPDTRAFLAAVQPVLRRLGAVVLETDQMAPTDVPLVWDGEVVAAVRPGAVDTDLADAVPRLIAHVERELGAPLSELSREDKQRAAQWLEERGAFTLRNAVELVADAMGVSRVTVYNYLSAVRNRPS